LATPAGLLLEETDLVILPHEYGYGVYRAEVGL
jgi:hypothetical protein